MTTDTIGTVLEYGFTAAILLFVGVALATAGVCLAFWASL